MNTLQKRINQRGQGGFTLIELLVVIAILAILAGVVVFAVGSSTDNAKVSACKAEAKTLSTAANAAKAARLAEATPTKDIFDFLDGTTATVSGAETFTGEYFTATATVSPAAPGVAFAQKASVATLPTGCTAPKDVAY